MYTYQILEIADFSFNPFFSPSGSRHDLLRRSSGEIEQIIASLGICALIGHLRELCEKTLFDPSQRFQDLVLHPPIREREQIGPLVGKKELEGIGREEITPLLNSEEANHLPFAVFGLGLIFLFFRHGKAREC